MPIAPIDMLRRLGSGVRPGAVRAEGRFFTRLDQHAQRGRLVRVDPALADIELSAQRLEQISIAADSAEAAGARSLLALDDRGAYVVNLGTRMIERGRQAPKGDDPPAHPPEQDDSEDEAPQAQSAPTGQPTETDLAGVLVGVDAVVVLPDDAETPVERLFASPEGLLDANGTAYAECSVPNSVCNASLAQLLAARMSGSAG